MQPRSLNDSCIGRPLVPRTKCHDRACVLRNRCVCRVIARGTQTWTLAGKKNHREHVQKRKTAPRKRRGNHSYLRETNEWPESQITVQHIWAAIATEIYLRVCSDVNIASCNAIAAISNQTLVLISFDRCCSSA